MPTPPRATPAPAPAPTPAPAPAPSAARVAAVKAIVKPATADLGDDEYTYGFRLWDAKFYPEAEQQLRLFVEKYPKHYRATYARNLLGRAYMDEGKPREAAPWFLENYQSDKAGERAPDSLLFLAESMIAINDTNRACLALAEFGEVYPAIASGRLQTQYKADTARVKCP
jgi:TolA-binding protein